MCGALSSTKEVTMSASQLRDLVPPARGLRSHYVAAITEESIGQEVTICGWINKVREQGKQLIFLDVRDHTGVIQCVLPHQEGLRTEFVVAIKAEVAQRPDGTENENLASGRVELRNCTVEVLNAAEPLPFPLSDRLEVDESTRLRYRYLDIRRASMQRNLRIRSRVNAAIRRSMDQQGFVEVETPLLWTPTPEGAREFVVPSRLQTGQAYVLPQSPQIAKQLLMVGGIDRYYQIARCLRDEDLRADRQFEFTQLDLEASFVGQEDIMSFISHAMASVVEDVRGINLPEVGEITWRDAMDRFGSDKPERRFTTELIDLSKIFASTSVRALSAPTVKALVAPEPEKLSRSRLDQLIDRAKELGGKGLLWLKVIRNETGLSVESPVAKFFSESEISEVLSATQATEGDIVLIVADEWEQAVKILGQIRLDLGRHLVDGAVLDFFWVVDFPLFEGHDEHGNLLSAHHPFTMPNLEDIELLESDPLSVRSQSYDLVLNGWELGSGSIRIHRRDIQEKIFRVLGISEEDAQDRFGFLLNAFRFGAPPHGGFAFGIDRLTSILAGEDTIREVIAFPKTQSGADLMTGAPKPLPPTTWSQLGLTPRPQSPRSS